MARLFFAIWPGAAAARELGQVGQALAALAGGKPVPAEKIHMTLAFIGAVSDDDIGSAAAAAASVRGSAVAMAIDSVGSFRRARVGWAAPSRPIPALASLQSDLARALGENGFALQDREFNPHATLVRKIARPVPGAPTAAIEWESHAFTLVETTGGRYEIRESWGLK